MKAGTTDLMKFKRLCRILGESLRHVVGLLELLWAFTAKNSPCGDVGRFTDEEIAIGVDYDGDPTAMVNALVETGWLDRHDQHRLIVHDWHEHAPNYVKGVCARKGGFVTERPLTTQGCQPKVSDPGLATQGCADLSHQSPTQGGAPPSLAKSNQAKSGQTKSSRSKPQPSNLDIEFAEQMAARISEMQPNRRELRPDKRPKTILRWANDFRLMRLEDDRQVDDISSLIEWIYRDNFESGVVLSAGKLRERYDDLHLKKNKSHKGNGNGRQLQHAVGPGQRFQG